MKPLVLIVLDGWGIRPERDNNAIALAGTPVYDELLTRYPHAQLIASGEAVGLPAGQMGNSEVGHMNMGAGRIVYQDLTRIDKSISDGDFFTSEALAAATDRCADGRHALHLIGLVSDGGVHSHARHLHALIELAARKRLPLVFVHAITDGRDTSPTGGLRYIGRLQDALGRSGTGRVATVVGRYYAMDRDRRWERTKLAWDAIVNGKAGAASQSPVGALEASYAADVTDEFVKPIVIVDAEGTPVGPIRDGDSVVFFNFRADRARQLTRAIAFDAFDGFERPRRPAVRFTTMTVYDRTFDLPVVFTPQTFSGNLADVLVEHGRTNLRLAETEKYAHVTYFFNCGREEPYPGEDRILVPSPKVATYDLMPEMSAPGITDALVRDLENGRHEVVICNFANADMVGHTGRLDAAIAAIETLDRCLDRVLTPLIRSGGAAIVTADHGNAEQMFDPETNAPHTAHTTYDVECIIVDPRKKSLATGGPDAPSTGLRNSGKLADVFPTLLAMMGLPQ
ncbi:MAG TPA: 2,3-bisphosphoglycerate-independent phosphoglycerate mutase, partial [Vicinamibacterales bacterium]|nr:2,3-bisphosphoglycerate-independent phosphoglycerate mutase [Vicinamibacterales bacterium]